jgi:glycosyltransferase involved in cell wall biosynthesis
MNILILNWRDPKNPSAGGAEVLTQELARRWVKKGHHVSQFSSMFNKAKKKEVIDGVHFIRQGSWWNVHFFAFFYYLRFLKNSTDVIIDEVHWFPFFSALYAPQKTVILVCEIANKLLFQLFPYPIAITWRWLEKIYLAIYKNVPAMAISQSTFDDLLTEGHISKNLIVLPMGLTRPAKIKHFPKEKVPTLICVSRLNIQKGSFEVIEAFVLVKKKIPTARLWLVGSGTDEIIAELKQKVLDNDLNSSITFYGFVTEERKFELLSRAHLLISPSKQEGWGLTIPEAGLMGTPSVVYNIRGFRDIIEEKKDGILTNTNPIALSKGIISVLQNNAVYKKLQSAAEVKAKKYSWDESATKALTFLKQQTHE